MKVYFGIILITLAVFTASASANSDHIITRENLEELRSKAKFDVIDYENHPFKDLTKEELIQKLGLMTDINTPLQPVFYGESSIDLPTSFHYKDKWPQCFHPIRDQQRCGSCWAFSASEVLSDRFCIASNGSINVVLSPQDLVSCDKNNFGCQGGYVNKSWDYIRDTGIVSDECLPYTSGNGNSGTCPFGLVSHSCKSGTYRKYKVVSHKQYTTISQAKETIFKKELKSKQMFSTGRHQSLLSMFEYLHH